MSINPEFKPLDDFYKDENKPLADPQLPVEALRDNPGEILIPNDNPTVTLKEPKPTPGFFENLSHAFGEYNEFNIAGKYIAREIEFMHPANDPVPDDFNGRDLKWLKDYPSDYWNFISEGQTPNEIKARQQYVSEQIKEKEYYASGGWMSSLIGGFAGALTSPSSALIFANSVRYASIGQSVIKGAIQAAPEVAAQTMAHEGFKQATDAGGNLHDFAINSVVDAMYGVAFMSGGAGLGAAYRGGKFWNIRKVGNYAYEGVDFAHEINPEGNGVTGRVIAKAAPGIYNLSAAKLNQAQQFADSAMHQGFLFAVPGLAKVAGNSVLGSPIVKGKISPFNTIRELTDKLASNTIISTSNTKGEATADSAEDILSAFNAGSANFAMNYNSHFYEQNGIEGGYNVRNATKSLIQKVSKNEQMSSDDFNNSVIDVALSADYNQSKSINAAAKLYREGVDETYKQYLISKGLNPDLPQVRNANGYYTFTGDTVAMTKRPQEFREVAIAAYGKQDALIEQYQKPIDDAQAFLDQLKAAKLTGLEPNRALAEEIKQAEVRVQEAKRNYEEAARNSKDPNIRLILEDMNYLTMDEAEQLRGILKFRTESQAQINAQKKKIAAIRKNLTIAKRNAVKAVTDSATNKNIKISQQLEQEISQAEIELKRLTDHHEEIVDDLEERARTGIIPGNFFLRDGNLITFKDPNDWAKFRKPFGSYEERYLAAEALRQTYLNNTPEQVQQSILGSIMPSLAANPLKKRTSMIPMQDMHNARFISNDVPRAYAAYQKTLGRHIALNTVFKHVNLKEGEHGPEGIIRVLTEERANKEAVIEKNEKKLTKEQLEKERLKLQKEFTQAQSFANRMYKVFMGQTDSSAAVLRFNRALKNFAATTKLGGVPIALLTDTGAIILKHGLWPYLRSGLKPMVQTLNGYLDTELADDLKANAAHAHLALQHMDHGYSQKFSNQASIGDVPIGTTLESALEKVAHLSGNFYGTNFIENFHQRQVALIMQSEIMAHLYSFKAGKLSKTNELKLLSIGIKPADWADIFIKNFEGSTGYKDKLGGYMSRWWQWEDNAALNRMSMSIRRGVYDTIVQRGLFTSPFWTNNPILGSMFMFHGWAFAAFTRYTVPIMQRPDADKMLGILAMLAIGSQTDVLRKIANGKKFDTENDETWFGKAMTTVSNSGILGHTTDLLQMANKLVDGELLPSQTERYTGYNKWSLLGPTAGMTDDLAGLVKMAITQRWNKDGFKKTVRLIPGTSSIGLRGLINKYLDSLDLPENYSQAKREDL